jgi:uncharacterized protein (TIRG00374 family)
MERRLEYMRKKWLLWGFLLVIGTYLLGKLIFSIEYSTLKKNLQQVDVSLLYLAIFVYLFMVFVRAGKWYILSRYHSIDISFIHFLGRYYMYYCLSSLTPLRSGDLFAPFMMSKDSKKRYKLYQSMIIDRCIESVVLAGLLLFSLWYMMEYIDVPEYDIKKVLIPLFIIAIASLIVYFIFLKTGTSRYSNSLKKIKLFAIDIFTFFMGLDKRVIIYQFISSSFVWFLDFMYIFIIMKAVGLTSLFFIHSLVSQVGSTIFSIITFVPAGIGTGAVSFVYIASLFNYSKDLLIIGTVLAKVTFLLLLLLLAVIGYCITLSRKKEGS